MKSLSIVAACVLGSVLVAVPGQAQGQQQLTPSQQKELQKAQKKQQQQAQRELQKLQRIMQSAAYQNMSLAQQLALQQSQQALMKQQPTAPTGTTDPNASLGGSDTPDPKANGDAKDNGQKAQTDKKANDDKTAKPADDAQKKEDEAGLKVKLAEMLIKDGVTDKAKERLHYVVDTYPDTDAAKKAKDLLAGLGK